MSIGVFFGSRSPEHDVSIITGELILSGLKKLGYPVVPVYLSKKGEWMIGEELGALGYFTKKETTASDDTSFKKYYLDLEQSVGKMVFRKKGITGKEVVVDLAFPAVHGSNGEDGTIQGMFEMFNLPYVGCDVTSSSIAMDKVLTKLFYQANGIPTTPFISFSRTDWEKNKSDCLAQVEKLTYPVFVKPPRLGSSIGITKVKEPKNLEFAIEVALHYDNKVLVEEGVENVMDVTCAVLGNKDPIPSLLQESGFGQDFFSYEDKYLKDGGAQLGNAQQTLQIPARLDNKTTQEIQQMSVRIFQLLGCNGIARFDFLYDKQSQKYFANEINPLPGTLYHHLWKASGIEFGNLLQNLLQYAQERQEEKKKTTSVFNSTLLQQAGSMKLGAKRV